MQPDGGPTGWSTPPVAPAETNAWYALTGERVGRLPFAPLAG